MIIQHRDSRCFLCIDLMREIVIWFDMDDTLCYYTKAINAARLACPGMAYPQSQLDFFRNLEPIPFAIEAFKELAGDPRFYVAIATGPSEENPLSYMEKRIWVEQHLGKEFVHRLYITPEKHRIIGDVLVDDLVSGKRMQHLFRGTLFQVSPESTNLMWRYIIAECNKLAADGEKEIQIQ